MKILSKTRGGSHRMIHINKFLNLQRFIKSCHDLTQKMEKPLRSNPESYFYYKSTNQKPMLIPTLNRMIAVNRFSHYLWPIWLAPLFFGACNGTFPSDSVRPNIIVIMADDLGYGGIGCYGEPSIKTPNIDALARNGLRFTDFHSNAPVCTPTRAALLTGNYQQRSGLEGVIYVRGEAREAGLDPSQITIAELLKNNGYATGIMGKWHLGYNKEFNPVHHGFDEFYGYVSGNVDYHSHYDNAGIYDWWHNLDSIQEEGYVTDNGAEAFGNNGGLNGQKGELLEGGHRVPAIVYWKNNIAAGESSETLVSMDLVPTILSICQAKTPGDVEFDGLDFSKLLLEEAKLEERTIFWRYQDQKAVRHKQWKLLVTEKDTALYDLEQDIKETMDISEKHQNVLEVLTKKLEGWEIEVGQKSEMKTL
jgi:arylsulfatase A-like enzyme